MAYHMVLTKKDVANPAVHARRDELMAENIPAGNHGLYSDHVISKHLRQYADGVTDTLLSIGKKAGLKPKDSEIQYGIHGNEEGPISFWAQKVFVS